MVFHRCAALLNFHKNLVLAFTFTSIMIVYLIRFGVKRKYREVFIKNILIYRELSIYRFVWLLMALEKKVKKWE